MMSPYLKICIIITPSIRSIAYLNVFKSLGVCPKEAIVIEGEISRLKDLQVEDKKFNYSENFFDINFDYHGFLTSKNDTIVYKTQNENLNSDEMHSLLKGLKSELIIFSGGGILAKETLNIGKKFIHIHPGIIPEYKGSTCFYYSLLNNSSLGATAFLMDEGIDTGEIITQCDFKINYDLHPNQSQFIDFILDPYIRALTLKMVLENYIQTDTVQGQSASEDHFQHYFIAHPLLRNLVAKKIRDYFRKDLPKGIFPKNQI